MARLLFSISLLFSQYSLSDSTSVAGEYLVKLTKEFHHKSAAEVAKILATKGAEKLPGIDNWYKVTNQKEKSLRMNPAVEFVEPNFFYYAVEIPNDPNYFEQWGMNNRGQNDKDGKAGQVGVDIKIEEAWRLSTGSHATVVAVIDTGIDGHHRDLKDNLWVNERELNGKPGVDDDGNGYVDDVNGYNFYAATADSTDDHGHGSHCAGVIGAKGNNGFGMAGINWQVQMMSVKFLNSSGSGTAEGAIKAIVYAVDNGAKILSNSWGGGRKSKALEEAIEYANAKGVLFVVAAGNTGKDIDKEPHYPASYNLANMISVAAINNQGLLPDWTNYGENSVDLAAPGENIFSTLLKDSFGHMSGTSMATPFVSGVAGLVFSLHPEFNHYQLKERILQTANKLSHLEKKVRTGGMLSAAGALKDL